MEEYWYSMVPKLSVSGFSKSRQFCSEIREYKVRNQRKKIDFAYLGFEHVQIMLEQRHEQGWVTGRLEAPLRRGVNF